jgi:tetratricopeptide (TPR) repeat protein
MKKTTLIIFFCVCSFLSWSQKKKIQGTEEEWMLQGAEKYRKARYEEAASAFNTLLTQNDTNRLARYNAGLSYYKAGDKEKASAAFDNVINGKLKDEIFFRSLYNKGLIEAEKKNWLNSIGCFREALLMKPNDKDTRYNLEKALEELKKTQIKKTRLHPKKHPRPAKK